MPQSLLRTIHELLNAAGTFALLPHQHAEDSADYRNAAEVAKELHASARLWARDIVAVSHGGAPAAPDTKKARYEAMASGVRGAIAYAEQNTPPIPLEREKEALQQALQELSRYLENPQDAVSHAITTEGFGALIAAAGDA